MTPSVHVSPRGEERIRRGHPWIYRSDVTRAEAAAGDIVSVIGPRDRRLGDALYSNRSQIALRMLGRGDRPPEEPPWRQRLESAIAFRRALAPDATAYRLVHGEADLLPSLIVDRYSDWLVVQALSQGMDRHLPEIVRQLVDLTGATGVLARNDPRVRLLEGLEQRVEVHYGTVPDTIEVVESGVKYIVDPWRGQKTGLFLDQRENRAAAAAYARGRVLDAFSYAGAFALRMASRADRVVALDISSDAVQRVADNAALNGIGTISARQGNVFDELRHFERSGERFDTIVLDPPAFAKNKAAVPGAIAGYKEINLRALRILSPGGVLITCSCSYNVDEALFLDVVHEAALDARAPVALLEKRMQSRDHPVLVAVPETYYLKCMVLRKLE